MRALILAAGEGTRLRPLTADRPKCLVAFRGRTLLGWQRRALEVAGVTDVTVVTGYRSEAVEALGVPTRHNARFAETNMVASLFAAEDLLDADLVIVYGDIVFEPRLIEALLAEPAPFAMVVNTAWRTLWAHRMPDPLADAETLAFDRDGHVTDLGRKASSYDQIQAQYTGLIRVAAPLWPSVKEYYRAIDREQRFDGQSFDRMFMTTFLRLLARDVAPLKAVVVKGGWLEVDSLADLAACERLPGDYPMALEF